MTEANIAFVANLLADPSRAAMCLALAGGEARPAGELAARAVDRALEDGRFTAARFAPYQRAVERGLRPFFRFIHKYYEPAFFEVFLRPRTRWVLEAVLSVLSGGAFMKMGWGTRAALAVLFAAARMNLWVRRRAGRPVESRLEW